MIEAVFGFNYRGERSTGCIRPVSKTAAKEIAAKKKAEAVEGSGKVDFRNRLIRVEAGYAKNREARSAPMNEVLTQTLQDSTLNRTYRAESFAIGQGQPYRDPDSAFATAVRRAGITDFTFHDLRHTFASRLVMAGVDLATVKELMGHKHIAMTLRYAHPAPSHKAIGCRSVECRNVKESE